MNEHIKHIRKAFFVHLSRPEALLAPTDAAALHGLWILHSLAGLWDVDGLPSYILILTNSFLMWVDDDAFYPSLFLQDKLA